MGDGGDGAGGAGGAEGGACTTVAVTCGCHTNAPSDGATSHPLLPAASVTHSPYCALIVPSTPPGNRIVVARDASRVPPYRAASAAAAPAQPPPSSDIQRITSPGSSAWLPLK